MRSGLVKGYGDTHERGREKYETILTLLPKLIARGDAAKEVAALRKAAGADETGDIFKKAVAGIGYESQLAPLRRSGYRHPRIRSTFPERERSEDDCHRKSKFTGTVKVMV